MDARSVKALRLCKVGLVLLIALAWVTGVAPLRADDGTNVNDRGPFCDAELLAVCSGPINWYEFPTWSCDMYCDAFLDWVDDECTNKFPHPSNPGLVACTFDQWGYCSYDECEESWECCEDMACWGGYCEGPTWWCEPTQ